MIGGTKEFKSSKNIQQQLIWTKIGTRKKTWIRKSACTWMTHALQDCTRLYDTHKEGF